MKRLPLYGKYGAGKYAYLDDADYERLKHLQWHLSANGYIVKVAERRTWWLHKIIHPSPTGMVTDHANGNKLDNRQSNLRSATQAENIWNRPKCKSNTSGHKGVCRHGKKWQAKIWYHKKRIYGTFVSKRAAAAWYKNMALKLHGEFANYK